MAVQHFGMIALGAAQLSVLAFIVLRASHGRLSFPGVALAGLSTGVVTAVLVVTLSGDLVGDDIEAPIGLLAGLVALGTMTTVAYLHGRG